MAADADGHILGVRVDHLDDVGAYPMAGSAAMIGAVIFTGPYRIPKLVVQQPSRSYTNTCSAGALPRPVADRDRTCGNRPSTAWPAGWASTRSSCAAAT